MASLRLDTTHDPSSVQFKFSASAQATRTRADTIMTKVSPQADPYDSQGSKEASVGKYQPTEVIVWPAFSSTRVWRERGGFDQQARMERVRVRVRAWRHEGIAHRDSEMLGSYHTCTSVHVTPVLRRATKHLA